MLAMFKIAVHLDFVQETGVDGSASLTNPTTVEARAKCLATVAGWQRCYVDLATPRAGLSSRAGLLRMVSFRCCGMAPFQSTVADDDTVVSMGALRICLQHTSIPQTVL